MINYTAIPKFKEVLYAAQEEISKKYSDVFLEEGKKPQLKTYIANYIDTHHVHLQGVENSELVKFLYNEMAEASFLTEYLERDDIEEININAWNDIVVTYCDGTLEPLEQKFLDEEHAINTIKHLLKLSEGITDDAKPIAQGHLPGNKRITSIKDPIVDKSVGISASIRLLHPSRVTKTELIRGKSLTKEMFDFMTLCLNHGVSFVVVGATSSGKTTLLNCLLSTIPNDDRIFVIESGTRELDLVKKDDDGNIINNVVATLTRSNDNDKFTIEQDDLVVASLRFSPNVIVVGEMRDREAHAAVEASLTGHTVVTTVHARSARSAHTRVALLMQKANPIEYNISLAQAAEAFPLTIYEQRLDDNSRKIMDISEAVVAPDMSITYRTLYRYVIDDSWTDKNDYNRTHISGHFEKCNDMSDNLRDMLTRGGAPTEEMKKYFTDQNAFGGTLQYKTESDESETDFALEIEDDEEEVKRMDDTSKGIQSFDIVLEED